MLKNTKHCSDAKKIERIKITVRIRIPQDTHWVQIIKDIISLKIFAY